MVYIGGYICRKIRSKLRQECRDTLVVPADASNKAHVFLCSKQYADTQGEGLLVPSEELLIVLDKMETKIRSLFQGVLYMDKVRHRIVCALSKAVGKSLHCSRCQKEAIVLHLFVSIRLHHFLREGNREFGAAKGRHNRKVLKFPHE